MDPHDGDDEGEVVYYRGVTGSGSRIVAQIQDGAAQKYLGSFKTREDAAKAYDEEAKLMFPHPVLNFKADGSLNEHRWGHSRYPGVSYHRRCRRWVAYTQLYGVSCHIACADTEEQAYETYCQFHEMWTRYRIDEMVGSLRERGDGEVLLRAMMRGADKTTRLKPTIESHVEALRDLLDIAIQGGLVQ